MNRISTVSFSFLVFLSLLATGVLAASCSSDVSVSTSGPTTSITTGTGSVITSTSTATSSSCSSDVTISATGVTVSDPVSGKYSSQTISTSGITHTFTLVPGTSGTYNYSVTVGSVTSTQGNLIVVNPDALTFSGAPSSVSKVAGQTFPLNVTITNTLGSDINTSYSLSLPSGLTASAGDATSSAGYVIPAGSSRTLQWTVSADSAGSYTASFSAGSSTGVFTSSVTVTAVATATPTPTTSASGAVTNPTATPAATATSTATPAPTATKEVVSTVPEETPTIIDSANEVSGTFTDTSSSFSLSFTAGAQGFEGDLTYRFPLDYADYLSGKIKFNPEPSSVSAGSVIATWKDVKLAAEEKFMIKVDVEKKLEKTVLDQFTAPKVVARKGGAATPKPAVPTEGATATAAPIQQGGGINWALIIGVIVVLAIAVFAYMKMNKTSKH